MTIAGIQLWFILSYTQAVLYGQNELGLHEVSHFVPRLSWTRAWESSKESLWNTNSIKDCVLLLPYDRCCYIEVKIMQECAD